MVGANFLIAQRYMIKHLIKSRNFLDQLAASSQFATLYNFMKYGKVYPIIIIMNYYRSIYEASSSIHKAAHYIKDTFENLLSIIYVNVNDVTLYVAYGPSLISIELAKISK